MSGQAIPHAEIKALNQRCFEWMSPEALITVTDQLNVLLGDAVMSRSGKIFREAFIASRFARRRGASKVRLILEDDSITTPDFEIDVGGRILRFETTEADIPGRRRQDEYRRPRKVEPVIFTNLDIMTERMRELAAAKAAKGYADCYGLVIYVNPPAFFFNPEMRWDNLLRGGEPAAAAFREVWAFRGEGALLWLDGVAQEEEVGVEF